LGGILFEWNGDVANQWDGNVDNTLDYYRMLLEGIPIIAFVFFAIITPILLFIWRSREKGRQEEAPPKETTTTRYGLELLLERPMVHEL